MSHTHTAVHISDSGAAGRAAIQATDQAALRLAAGIARTVVDRVYAEYTAFAATSAVIPLDDTIPQRTEGFEVMSVTIAPKSPTNRLRIRASVVGANNTGVSWTTLAVFSSLSLDAIQAVPLTQPAPEHSQQFVCEVEFVPGVTAPVTISARVGVVNGTHIFRLNGNVTGRYMGGTSRCTLIVEELTP